jgi:hypothetical protein
MVPPFNILISSFPPVVYNVPTVPSIFTLSSPSFALCVLDESAYIVFTVTFQSTTILSLPLPP